MRNAIFDPVFVKIRELMAIGAFLGTNQGELFAARFSLHSIFYNKPMGRHDYAPGISRSCRCPVKAK